MSEIVSVKLVVAQGTQCVHEGVAYYGGETLEVPETLAAYLVRSGWATPAPDDEPEPAPAKAPAKAAAKAVRPAKSRRRDPRAE